MSITFFTDLVMILLGIGLGNSGKIFSLLYRNYKMRKELEDIEFEKKKNIQ